MDISKIAALFNWAVESVGHLFIDHGKLTKLTKVLLVSAAALTGTGVIFIAKTISEQVKDYKINQEKKKKFIENTESIDSKNLMEKIEEVSQSSGKQVIAFQPIREKDVEEIKVPIESFLKENNNKPTVHFKTAKGSFEIVLTVKGDSFFNSKFSVLTQKDPNGPSELVEKTGKEIYNEDFLESIGLGIDQEMEEFRKWFSEGKLNHPGVVEKPPTEEKQEAFIFRPRESEPKKDLEKSPFEKVLRDQRYQNVKVIRDKNNGYNMYFGNTQIENKVKIVSNSGDFKTTRFEVETTNLHSKSPKQSISHTYTGAEILNERPDLQDIQKLFGQLVPLPTIDFNDSDKVPTANFETDKQKLKIRLFIRGKSFDDTVFYIRSKTKSLFIEEREWTRIAMNGKQISERLFGNEYNAKNLEMLIKFFKEGVLYSED
ncbi:MAG: hypothetical protein JSR80_04535 [Verrucomicrobia bacterium]|nr:hypothetical protein [Verrucomicrobiota bacterium]